MNIDCTSIGLSTITPLVALAIGQSEHSNQIRKFWREARENEKTLFTHFSFYYSWPERGKSWKEGKSMQFHRVYTRCHCCGEMPSRNFAGIGWIYVVKLKQELNRGRMVMMCHSCSAGYRVWSGHPMYIRPEPKQLSLF